jgi:NMD protein affecting ribosome stability and mRNA decay
VNYPPVFSLAAGSAAVVALLGSNPVRVWPFGQAPQNETRPYAVHQLIYGSPENSMSCTPDIDNTGIQIDVYAQTASAAREVVRALTDAFEAAHNQVVAWNGETKDVPTGLYRVSFTVEFWTGRNAS